MSKITLRGLTWDHPRAYQGLLSETARFNAESRDITLTWEKHSLRRFEEAPLAEIAADYDLVIFDHPFVGDAAAAGCLIDLGNHSTCLDLPAVAADTLGQSYSSYCFAGGQWAVPVDAACQTAVVRPDLLEKWGLEVPRTLDDVLAFGRRRPLALALAVPHAFMNHLSLCGLLEADIGGGDAEFLDLAISAEAIAIQRQLVASVPPEARDWSSIATLEAMAGPGQFGYCPLVFCFNTYSRTDRRPGTARLQFTGPPALSGTPHGGTVIGGAGLGVSASSGEIEAALAALVHLSSPTAQKRMAVDGGQVGSASVWSDSAADTANGGFFSACRTGMERAQVRPRFRGYIDFQNAAGKVLRDAVLKEDSSPPVMAAELQALYEKSWKVACATS